VAMLAWIARVLLILGTVALTLGLANILAPAQVFPSRMTCVTDYDMVMCHMYPWAQAPWLALVGGAAIATSGAVLRPRAARARTSDEGTT